MCDSGCMLGGGKKKVVKKQKGRGGIQDYISTFFDQSNQSNQVKQSNKSEDMMKKAYEEGVRQGIQMTLRQMKDIQDMLAKSYTSSLSPVEITMRKK